MNLAVPLTAAGEAKILFQAGATEFYCGVQTEKWGRLFGDHDSISRRQGAANLSSVDELKIIINECRALGAPLFLTLNGTYTEEQLLYIFELADIFEHLGGSGVMTMDISLLLHLKKSKLICGLSIMAAVSSVSALGFYNELGIQRAVFPRFLKPFQIKEMLDAYPDIVGESVVWLDKCRFIDGYCRFLHSTGYVDGDLATESCEVIFSYDTTYRLPACFELYGFPPASPACGACNIDALKSAGVGVFKMGGRGRSLQTRLEGVNFLVKSALCKDNAARKNLYKDTFGANFCPEVCYL